MSIEVLSGIGGGELWQDADNPGPDTIVWEPDLLGRLNLSSGVASGWLAGTAGQTQQVGGAGRVFWNDEGALAIEIANTINAYRNFNFSFWEAAGADTPDVFPFKVQAGRVIRIGLRCSIDHADNGFAFGLGTKEVAKGDAIGTAPADQLMIVKAAGATPYAALNDDGAGGTTETQTRTFPADSADGTRNYVDVGLVLRGTSELLVVVGETGTRTDGSDLANVPTTNDMTPYLQIKKLEAAAAVRQLRIKRMAITQAPL